VRKVEVVGDSGVISDSGEIIQNKDIAVNVFPALYTSSIEHHYKPFKRNSYQPLQSSVVNEPTEEQMSIAEAICKEVESIIKVTILSKLLSLQEHIFDRNEINDENKEFVEELIESQMFAVYIERHYGYLT
jgi:hypothetical protein